MDNTVEVASVVSSTAPVPFMLRFLEEIQPVGSVDGGQTYEGATQTPQGDVADYDSD